jgi:hypothetical protein
MGGIVAAAVSVFADAAAPEVAVSVASVAADAVATLPEDIAGLAPIADTVAATADTLSAAGTVTDASLGELGINTDLTTDPLAQAMQQDAADYVNAGSPQGLNDPQTALQNSTANNAGNWSGNANPDGVTPATTAPAPGSPGGPPIQDVVNGAPNATQPGATVTGSDLPFNYMPNSTLTPDSMVPQPASTTPPAPNFAGNDLPSTPDAGNDDGGILSQVMKSPFTPLAAAAIGGYGTEQAKLKQQQLQYQQLLDQQARKNAALAAVKLPPGNAGNGGLLSTTMPQPQLPTYGQ